MPNATPVGLFPIGTLVRKKYSYHPFVARAWTHDAERADQNFDPHSSGSTVHRWSYSRGKATMDDALSSVSIVAGSRPLSLFWYEERWPTVACPQKWPLTDIFEGNEHDQFGKLGQWTGMEQRNTNMRHEQKKTNMRHEVALLLRSPVVCVGICARQGWTNRQCFQPEAVNSACHQKMMSHKIWRTDVDNLQNLGTENEGRWLWWCGSRMWVLVYGQRDQQFASRAVNSACLQKISNKVNRVHAVNLQKLETEAWTGMTLMVKWWVVHSSEGSTDGPNA